MLLYLMKREALKRGRLLIDLVKSQKRLLAGTAKPKELKPGIFPNGTTHADANDLPVPEGCYSEWYKSRNTKYSAFMYSGLVAALASIYLFAFKEEVDWNYRIPEFVEEEEEDEEEDGVEHGDDDKKAKDKK